MNNPLHCFFSFVLGSLPNGALQLHKFKVTPTYLGKNYKESFLTADILD